MKRRNFIHMNLAALGGVLIGSNFPYDKAMAEITRSFQHVTDGTTYDLIINGAGLSGCFAAIQAAQQGLKVLVTDKRTSPGFDLAAKRKLWLNTDGQEEWTEDLIRLFLPENEKEEIFNQALGAPNNSSIKNETLLFAGSIKKGLLRSLLANNIDVMLMTDICGIVSDQNKYVSGVIVACKQGVYSIPCCSFIDASDNNLFTRHLCNQEYKISRAGFVMELQDVDLLDKAHISVNSSYNLSDNKIEVHHGKKSGDQYFLSFQFPVDTNNISTIEQKARLLTAIISKGLPTLDAAFKNARLCYYAQECSFYLADNSLPYIPFKAYTCIENHTIEHSYSTVLKQINSARKKVKATNWMADKRELEVVHLAGGKSCKFAISKDCCVNESGHRLSLTPYPIQQLQLPSSDTALLIAGGGTAGVTAALSSAQKGLKPLVVEYFNDLGGTKTMGGVTGYYLGLNKHPYILELEKNIQQTAKEYNIVTNATCRCLFSFQALKQYDCEMINGAILCGAQTNKKKLEQVLLCTNGELKWMNASLTIDATGDGDIAYFAGEHFELGNTRMGMTQNFSQWDLPFRSKNAPAQTINKDYDIIDNTKITELQRGLFLSHYESLFYDFYPMLTVREARRPEGLYQLNTVDVLQKTWFQDTIVNASSDFDPHHFGNSEYSRCAFMLPHSNQITVNIPYRSIVPKTIDGLLLSGRGISQTHNALQFTRMSADVSLLGHVTGQIAAAVIHKQIQPREFSVFDLQKEWLRQGFLTKENTSEKATAQNIVDKLVTGNQEYLFICCRKDKQEMLPALKEAYLNSKSIWVAKALAWFGQADGIDAIRTELSDLFIAEQQAGHSNQYFEMYDPTNLYWKINQNIALLGMCPNKKSTSIIHQILSNTNAGGCKVEANDLYNKNRIDLQLVPYYNRIVNLCFYIERIPDNSFANELERLIASSEITRQVTSDYNQTRWRLYGGILEVSIASALARCGSIKGIMTLVEYLKDVHSDFRSFANQELTAILKKDMKYDYSKWKSFVEANQSLVSTTPLLKKIEL